MSLTSCYKMAGILIDGVSVGTTYELRSHSLLPMGPRMTDKRLVSVDLAVGTD